MTDTAIQHLVFRVAERNLLLMEVEIVESNRVAQTNILIRTRIQVEVY